MYIDTHTKEAMEQSIYKIVDDTPTVGKDFNEFFLSYLKIARTKPKRERSGVR